MSRLSGKEKEDRRWGLDKMTSDSRKIGTICCFRFFSCYLRGKEEIVVTLRACPGHRIRRSIMLRVVKEGHAPASPAHHAVNGEISQIQFLLAGYAKYERPMVWCRTMHEEHSFDEEEVDGWSRSGGWHKTAKSTHDCPILLPSMYDWVNRPRELGLRDFIAELMQLTMDPPPVNPFAVDFDRLSSHPSDVRAMAEVGALIHQLQQLPYSEPVAGELERLYALYAAGAARLLSPQQAAEG
eukprot:TRINITY_DN21875_c0_g2_i1.p2 TRINITY_DN21875_c0_g2~~TRINITY_DN21875_c0_g2_i1.p2  ORF type:complete len:240 (+),score=86.24 TRINITY_DN21875_c0_g2_i1:69-788(+)